MNLVPLNTMLRRNASVHGGLALIDGDQTISWGDLEVRANRRARLIQTFGIGAGDLVTFNLPNGVEFFETTFALWKLGATPNPISPKMPSRELSATLDAARPALFIGGADVDFATTGARLMHAGAESAQFSSEPVDELISEHWRATTSGGSTGRPKVIVDHQAAFFDVDSPIRRQPSGGVILNPGPLYHSAAFLSSHHSMFIGGTVVNMNRFDPEQALKLIAEYRVQWVNFVPTMMSRIWQLPEEVRLGYDVSSLETVFHMASPMPAWLKEKWIEWLGAAKIWELYSGTERIGSTVIGGEEWLAHRGSVGKAAGGCQICIFGPTGAPCEANEIGDIFFIPADGAGKTYHYLGADSKRRADGWESLGDIGWLDREGYLYLSDRRTDMILRGGANIYPAEVESALDEHPSVASSIVVGLPDDDLGQRVHAIVQLRHGHAADPTRICEFLAERLALNKIPESFEWTSESLRDDAGKARRSALRDARMTLLKPNAPTTAHVFDIRSSKNA
jgi:bile acid-coenzyme A ligase